MKFLSLFSGIEAASVAWEPLGWEAVGFSEIEKFPCEFLASRYPDIPNLGDVTQITEAQIASLGKIDVVVFGSPCQDLSIAGKRKGLLNESGDVTRSGLFFSAINIFNWARKHCGARYALWENVPGAFSSNKGRDFASVVSLMAGIDDVDPPTNGWGKEGVALGENGLLEWCVLDAQWFGVAQRRQRVFAILDTGNWADRPPILLEPVSLRGDTPPCRETGQTVTCGTETGVDEHGTREVITWPAEIAPTLNAHFGNKMGLENQHINGGYFDNPTYGIPGNWIGRKPENGGNQVEPFYDLAPCQTKMDRHAVAYSFDSLSSNSMKSKNPISGCNEVNVTHGVNPSCNQGGNAILQPVAHAFKVRGGCEGGGKGYLGSDDAAFTLSTHQDQQLFHKMQVRRLTPIECERLQGFPDNWTKINAKTPDSARYKALGNSMAVPVMHWIGKQIDRVTGKNSLRNNIQGRKQFTDLFNLNNNQ